MRQSFQLPGSSLVEPASGSVSEDDTLSTFITRFSFLINPTVKASLGFFGYPLCN